MTDSSGKPVRLATLVRLIGDDPVALREVLAVYGGSAEQSAADIRRAIQASDAAQLRAAAHRLKSPSLAIGAEALGETCALLEEAACTGRLEDIDMLVDAFEAAFADVMAYLASGPVASAEPRSP